MLRVRQKEEVCLGRRYPFFLKTAVDAQKKAWVGKIVSGSAPGADDRGPLVAAIVG
jgi:hypothetical protein